MRCRKVRLVLRYDMLNIHLAPQKFANHALLLFYPLKDEKNCYQVFHIGTKQTVRPRSPGCCKNEQSNV